MIIIIFRTIFKSKYVFAFYCSIYLLIWILGFVTTGDSEPILNVPQNQTNETSDVSIKQNNIVWNTKTITLRPKKPKMKKKKKIHGKSSNEPSVLSSLLCGRNCPFHFGLVFWLVSCWYVMRRLWVFWKLYVTGIQV